MQFYRPKPSGNTIEQTSDIYQQRLAQHQGNAGIHVKSTGIIYDAICLAQAKGQHARYWQPAHAEHHPAILQLCAFWHCFTEAESIHAPCIPYLQCFVGDDYYAPVGSQTLAMSCDLSKNVVYESLKESSVLFGDDFLLTFLASEAVSQQQSSPDTWIYYTVNNKPLFTEPRTKTKPPPYLAWRTLQGLHDFPHCFPERWQALVKHHQRGVYELH